MDSKGHFSMVTVMILMVMSVSTAALFQVEEARALPQDYPVFLSGGYATEVMNETRYIDYLQPGSTENYLIHLYNDEQDQNRYRVEITDHPDDWLVFLRNGVQEWVVDLDPGMTSAVSLNMKTPTEMTGDIEIMVSDDDSTDEWNFTLTIVCQEGPLMLSVPSDSYILGRQTPAEFDITIENIGNTVLNVSLDMDGIVYSDSRMEGAWSVVFSRRVFEIAPGNTRTVSARVWSPELEPKGSKKVSTLIASVEGITRPFTVESISFVVQTIYDLRSSVMPMDYQDVSPGGQTEFTLNIENWADDYDTVSLDIFEKPSGWDVVFNDTMDPTSVPLTVDPEGERTFHPVVIVPRNAIAGEQEVILLAEGRTNTTYMTLRVRVEREDLFSLTPRTMSGSGGTFRMTVGENLLPFKIVNRGNYFDTATISIENSPQWASLVFHSVAVGDGSNETVVSGQQGINISGSLDRTYVFSEETLSIVDISFSAGQTATLYLKSDIALDASALSGSVGIKYTYGIFREQRYLQTSIKLILADIAIVDDDGDGTPDLEVIPKKDIEVGDTIHFMWTLRNDYPYETTGLEWSITLSGKELIRGEVPPISPGETKGFNESWKADKSTNVRNRAILRITGDAYPSEDRSPSAKTDEDVYIEAGPGTPPWGLMILFGGIMILLIAGFVGYFIYVRKDLREKEARERQRYESLYGGRERPSLRADRRERRSLRDRERPGLPSVTGKEEKTGISEGKVERPGKKRGSRGRKKKSRKGPSSEGEETGKEKGRSKDPAPNRKKRAKDLDEMEVLEEMEEL